MADLFLCEPFLSSTATPHFEVLRCNLLIIVDHLSFSMLLWTKDFCRGKLGGRLVRIAASSYLLLSSILHLVCNGGSHSNFLRLCGPKKDVPRSGDLRAHFQLRVLSVW